MALFTLLGYEEMLRQGLASGYSFLSFDDAERFVRPRVCLMRHDVDASPALALRMARVEARVGVRATYFLMLRSPLYNLFSRANHQAVEEILALGHDIGLHFDGGFALRGSAPLPERVVAEAGVLQSLFGPPIRAVSFHQPDQAILSGQVRLPGFINTYDADDLAGFFYVSDSNKVWKRQSPDQLFAQGEHARLHLLIHPLWWMGAQGNESTEEMWEAAMQENFRLTQAQLLATERAYGGTRRMSLQREDGVP